MFEKLSDKDIFRGPAPVETFALITVVITNLLNNNTVTIVLQDFLKNFAVQVCAIVIASGLPLGCVVTP